MDLWLAKQKQRLDPRRGDSLRETRMDLWLAKQKRSVWLSADTAFLILLPVLVAARDLWAAQLLLAMSLLVFPGTQLLRIFRVPGKAVADSPVYVPAASLAVLIAVSLVVDLGGLAIGVRQPLRAVPLLIGMELAFLALTVAARRAPDSTAIPWHRLNIHLRDAWPLVLPLVAVLGAQRLNNGYGNTVQVLAIYLCFAAMVWVVVQARPSRTLFMITLYAVSLALMWGYSLRGTLVYGFDISNEYGILHQTVTSGVWHLSHPNDAYAALPSVTLLPAALHFLTGISALMTFKLLYPAITAFLPVGIFSLTRRFLRPRWGFMAATFVIVQGAFGQELPALARQEIALVFFVAMLNVMFQAALDRRASWILTGTFSLGMAITHYSTAYFAIGMFGVLLVLQWLLARFVSMPRVVGTYVVAFAVATGAAAAWYGPLTNSAQNITQLVSSGSVFSLPSFTSGRNPILQILDPVSTDTTMSAAKYQQAVASYYQKNRKFLTPSADATSPQFALQNYPTSTPKITVKPLYTAINLGYLLAVELADLTAAIMAVYLALSRRTPPKFRPFFLLGIAAFMEIVVLRASPVLSNAYNPPRALLQGFIVLSVPLMWLIQWISRRLKRYRRTMTVAGLLAIALLFSINTGLRGAILGGGVPTNLANSGEDYNHFDDTPQDAAAAHWLAAHHHPHEIVYADRYGTLRLLATGLTQQALMPDITPQTIDLYGWVYADSVNIVNGQANSFFEDHPVSYRFPIRFLNLYMGVMYTNGSAKVFHE